MNRAARIIYRAQLGDRRAQAQIDRLQVYVGGIAGAATGTAIALIIVRPVLSFFFPGMDGVWR